MERVEVVNRELRKKRVMRMAEFIGKLKPRKLKMYLVAETRKRTRVEKDIWGYKYTRYSTDPEDMKPRECKSAACVMGWMPHIDPAYFKYAPGDERDGSLSVSLRRGPGRGEINYHAMVWYLGIADWQASGLFGSGGRGYQTPKQVSAALREFAETDVVPEVCTTC
jgi:hypothetical protein